MYSNIPTHKVFVSFHHHDEGYKNQFCHMMGNDVVDRSVEDGDINPNNSNEYTRQLIRDDFIADATVTVVLIGPCTWQRKHVDWEIGSSLRDTHKNPRCGLLGILLPNHSNFGEETYKSRLIPPRLADNVGGDYRYAGICDWTTNVDEMKKRIHAAYTRRDKNPPPDNSRDQYKNNRGGDCASGWQD